jgi:hypothetical protein
MGLLHSVQCTSSSNAACAGGQYAWSGCSWLCSCALRTGQSTAKQPVALYLDMGAVRMAWCMCPGLSGGVKLQPTWAVCSILLGVLVNKKALLGGAHLIPVDVLYVYMQGVCSGLCAPT